LLCYLSAFKSKYWQNNLSDPIFLKACFVLDTTEHIIYKNGELGISCNIVMSKRVLYGGTKLYGQGENLLFFIIIFFLSFPISDIAKILQSISISIVFWDYARYLQKTCMKCIICRDPKLVPHPPPHKDGRLAKKLVWWPMLIFFFQPRT
jgi:hypothetical protein